MANQLEIDTLKRSLLQLLREKSQIYLSNLKLWFSLKITKDEFDRRSRELLSPEHISLHNRFLLAIITRCQSVCLPLQPDLRRIQMVESRPKLPIVKQEHTFKSYASSVSVKDEQKPLLEVNSMKQKPRSASELRVKVPARSGKRPKPSFEYEASPRRIKSELVSSGCEKPKSLLCSNELKLPDLALLHGRILVHSFDMDLDGADDKMVHVLVKAVHGFLKNILVALSKRRHGFQLRNGKVVHSCGLDVPDPWLSGTWNLPYSSRAPVAVIETSSESAHAPALRPIHESAEQSAAYEEACTSQSKRNFLPAATTTDLFEALQIYNNVIPSNTVYVMAMERLSSKKK